MQGNPDFGRREPSPQTTTFLERIENADPNAPGLSEDDLGPSWGHWQFTAGGLTCATVLETWDHIGNTDIACRFIAAAIKTCRVARHLCFIQGNSGCSYLSDNYLQIMVDRLLELWSAAGGVRIFLPDQHLLYLQYY